MSKEKEGLLAMLTSRDERMQNYLRNTTSPDDIVRNVTAAFAGDVARIMENARVQADPARPPRQRR